MEELKLILGNKNYSSWSFRPWLTMKAAGVSFKEEVIPFDFPTGNKAIKSVSESGKVPLLVHGDFKVWESLAIIEYIAELFPDKNIWPTDLQKRSRARAISTEMACGFHNLRGTCHMNMRRTPAPLEVNDAIKSEIARIDYIWKSQIEKNGGPFLFGDFSAADAMYAPVVNRFHIYGLTPSAQAETYMGHVMSHPAWKAWDRDSKAEPWVVHESEI